MKCTKCGRAAVFVVKRGRRTKVVSDEEHDLCARCYRDQQNRFRAESKQVRR